MELNFRHVLDAEADALFIAHGPRDSLWLQQFVPGDAVICCYHCRKVFYADDWNGACPLCNRSEPLYFISANQLLLRERETRGGYALDRPFTALRARRAFDRPGYVEEVARLEHELLALKHERIELGFTIRNFTRTARSFDKNAVCAGCAAFLGLFMVRIAGMWMFK